MYSCRYLVGAPIPVPSLFEISAQTMAFVNLLSLLVTLVGSIAGVGFYLERRTNTKFERIEKHVSGLKIELKEIELRIQNTFHKEFNEMEKTTEYKVQKAKEIQDEKFRRIDEAHREHERRIDVIDRDSYDYKTKESKK